ncbi:hypothetical protein HOO54_03545 [Bacillus sp. WMMC1349]|uniref:DUF6917 domain-containing protein n=1 Tax=Bacillus sp. WMMC1349 TaxID=2736254 RepID=UPI0015561F0A|nr:hypothetical protein [Bacillus sp. WMMC1349]NPC91341.1 hypothetical protein [Bacillus sp. WMMC1349]
MKLVNKRIVKGAFVKLLFHKQKYRGMRLMDFETRCVQQGEIHEIVTTTHKNAKSGDTIDEVGFLGFAEMNCGGVIERGDQVIINNKVIGYVLGFDDCHFPNHYNVLIAVEQTMTADELHIAVENEIIFGG